MLVTKEEKRRDILFTIILAILAFLILYSFALVVSSSFATQDSINENGYKLIPAEFTLQAYDYIFTDFKSIMDSYKVTIINTVAGAVLGVLFTGSMGYVISRDDFPYRRGFSLYAYFTMLFNGGMVASYILIISWLKLKNTYWAVILPSCVSVWNMMLMKSYFKSLPFSLIEAAKIDGMSELGIFFKIVMPLSKPAFATIALFFALACWNQWHTTMLYTDARQFVTLQYMLMKLQSSLNFLNTEAGKIFGAELMAQNMPQDNARFAMCVVAAGPVTVVFPFFQKYFVKGINVGAIKG